MAEDPFDKLNRAWAQMQQYVERGDAEKKQFGEALAETKTAQEKANADIDAAQDEIQAQRRELEELKRWKIEVENKARRPSNGSYYGPADSQPSEAKAAALTYLRKGVGALTEAQRKTLFVADSTAGGYLVPDEVRGPIIERLVLITPFRGLVTTYTISTDNAKVPVEQGQYSAYMVGEMDDISAETSSSQIGMEDIPVFTGVAKIVLSQNLVDDAAFPLESYITRKVAQRFSKLQGQKFINGNGRTSPEGVLTNSAVSYVAGGDASTLTYDGLNDLVHDLPTDYARGARLGMTRKTIGVVRGLKDLQDRPLWEPNVPAGDPMRILGVEVVEMPDMPEVASNAYPIIYGDFEQAYNWIDRIQLDMARLTDSKYIEKEQVALLFRARFGGQVVLAEALRKLKIATS